MCGLRCKHCFVGEHLQSNFEMPLENAISIINYFKSENLESVTLLGGEPSLYKNLDLLIDYLFDHNISTRIVTNGQRSFQVLLTKLSERVLNKIHVCFSIDGSNDTIHDSMRGKGTFKQLLNSIELSTQYNLSISGICSLNIDNFFDLKNIADLCFSFNMKYLNVHYITDRGFAERKKVVDIDSWKNYFDTIESTDFKIPIRFERTFVSKNVTINCEVSNKENIIIDPHGNIYGCTMFMNFSGFESGKFISNKIQMNKNNHNENTICTSCSTGCPAIKIVNPELVHDASDRGLYIDCIFNKSLLN